MKATFTFFTNLFLHTPSPIYFFTGSIQNAIMKAAEGATLQNQGPFPSLPLPSLSLPFSPFLSLSLPFSPFLSLSLPFSPFLSLSLPFSLSLPISPFPPFSPLFLVLSLSIFVASLIPPSSLRSKSLPRNYHERTYCSS
jgi:hypothetical protein